MVCVIRCSHWMVDMPRNENLALKRQLEDALRAHLSDAGLDATSYQVVADELGISRALVQHYYPRKMDFAAYFLETLLVNIANILGIDSYAKGARLATRDAYLMGCLYYEYLLDPDGGRRLLFDILKNRELADELMYHHYQWGLANVDPSRPRFEERSQEVIKVWGGFYDLMYHSIKNDFEIDVPANVIPIFTSFLEDSKDHPISAQELEETAIDPHLLEKLKTSMQTSRQLPATA